MKLKTGKKLKIKPLKHVAILPTLVTLGNIVCGFASIILAARSMTEARFAVTASSHFEMAAWLVIVAMVFDALDGKVARMTRTASKFGGELDSLCDVVSFGVAPAFLAWVAIDASGSLLPPKVSIAICAVYMACAALRLARFNVENSVEEEAHLSFRGLPSPAAAGVVVSLCLLASDQAGSPFAVFLVRILPFLVLAAGLSMISRIRYAHVVNKLFRGHHRFTRLAEVVLVALMVALHPVIALAVAFCGYACSGPVLMLFRPRLAPVAPPAPSEETRP